MLKTFQILGYSAGIPNKNNSVTSVMVSDIQFDLMIDCGENTYMNWKNSGYKWERLKIILITHMHFDHIGGLIPLLFYRKIKKVKGKILIVGPKPLKKLMELSFQYQKIDIRKYIKFINVSEIRSFRFNSSSIDITAKQMVHKIDCWGYRIADKLKSLVFMTDTIPNENSILLSTDADILIHEATYLDSDKVKALKQFHSTPNQAKEIAQTANVKRLFLTHFSENINKNQLNKIFYNNYPCVIYNKKQII